MKDLSKFLSTTAREFLNEQQILKEDIKSLYRFAAIRSCVSACAVGKLRIGAVTCWCG